VGVADARVGVEGCGIERRIGMHVFRGGAGCDMQASDVQKQLEFAHSYTLSAEDISRIVRARKAKGLLKKPLNQQRAELLMAKRAAEDAGDEATLQRCAPAFALLCCRVPVPAPPAAPTSCR
jgi:hypothetical protein